MTDIHALLQDFALGKIIPAIFLVAAGYFISRLINSSLEKALQNRMRRHQSILLRRAASSLIFLLFFFSAIQQMGFNISALLGTAGLLTVALGFAAKTSASNLVSGLFIMGEKPFEIGDNVNINGSIGEITDIGYMSVRIRTSDNTMVRIPNETLISSAILNLSHYPTRRVTILVGVGYQENIEQVMTLLTEIAKREPQCLSDPAPYAHFESFGDSAINLKLHAWTVTPNALEFKSCLHASIKRVFDEHGVDMPYPCRTLYTGKTEKNIKPLSNTMAQT